MEKKKKKKTLTQLDNCHSVIFNDKCRPNIDPKQMVNK